MGLEILNQPINYTQLKNIVLPVPILPTLHIIVKEPYRPVQCSTTTTAVAVAVVVAVAGCVCI